MVWLVSNSASEFHLQRLVSLHVMTVCTCVWHSLVTTRTSFVFVLFFLEQRHTTLSEQWWSAAWRSAVPYGKVSRAQWPERRSRSNLSSHLFKQTWLTQRQVHVSVTAVRSVGHHSVQQADTDECSGKIPAEQELTLCVDRGRAAGMTTLGSQSDVLLRSQLTSCTHRLYIHTVADAVKGSSNNNMKLYCIWGRFDNKKDFKRRTSIVWCSAFYSSSV